MRVLLVGVGAVGIVLHRTIEQQKGNEVTFLVRAGKKRALERTKIVDARSGELRVRERPTAVEIGQVRPVYDTVLLCVRGEQLEAAIADLGPVAVNVRLATVTPGPEGLALLRARYPGHAAVRIAPVFMAYPDGDVIALWQPPVLKTSVCHDDGDEASQKLADELAAALVVGGIPARARAKMPMGTDTATDAMAPLLAAYALSGYDADALARDRGLQTLAADAIAEVMALDGAPGIASALVRRATAPLVRIALSDAAQRMPGTFRAMWRAHGPKIDGQTHASISALVRRAQAEQREVPALEEMRHRLDARPPATVANVKESA